MKKYSSCKYIFLAFLGIFILSLSFFINKSFQTKPFITQTHAASPIQHVFVIFFENHNWSDIKGNAQAPYINNTLVPNFAHAEQYYNPPGNHPSAPNYVWTEAGAAVAGSGDCTPAPGCESSGTHLADLLTSAGFTWKEYAGDTSGTSCILDFSGADVNHVPFSYFTDVISSSANCIAHERPLSELTTELQNNTVPNYVFITPSSVDNTDGGTLQQGDTWLSTFIQMIQNSNVYSNSVIFFTYDEAASGDGPIPFIVISPYAKKNYSNTIHYDHSSLLKTVEEIFGVSPMLGNAATATDLSDLFTVPLTGTGVAQPTPSLVTPTLFCLGSCPTNPTPTGGSGSNPTQNPPVTTGAVSPAPTQNPCTTAASTDETHAFKTHIHTNGAISNLLLMLLQFLIQLLQQLLGITIPLPPTGSSSPTPVTTNPSPAGVSPTPGTSTAPSPTMNPCVSPTGANTAIPTNAVPTAATTSAPGTTASPTSSSSLGPKTSLHYTANSNFSGSTYAPGTDGFNLADIGSVSEANSLPSGVKGLVYLSLCSGADANFVSTAQPFVGNAKVFGFFLYDEPDPTGQYKTLCSASNLKAESDWIHKNDPGAKTFIVVMNMSSSKTPTYINTYNPSNSDIDYYGIDAYPCRTDYNGCDYTIVNRNITAATAAGISIADIVPVYQTFGGGSWVDDGGGAYIMPTASEETQLLTTWASVVSNPGFDYAYSWGSQNSDQALSASTALQQVFATHNK